MDFFSLLQAVITAVYLAGTVLVFAGPMLHRERLKSLGNAAAVAGFALHTVDLALYLSLERGAALTEGSFYFSFLAWSILAIYFILWWRLRLGFLGLTAAPLALLLFAASLATVGTRAGMPKALTGLFFSLHIGALFASISLLTMAFGAAVAFLYLERKIKTKTKLTGLGKEMPSLSVLDKVNHWTILPGFPLFTLGVGSGFIWARLEFGRVFSRDPKEVVALFIWFLFALLFHQRLALGWKGRKTASMAVWVFAFTLISLAGVNLLLPTHHGFK